MRVIPVWRTHLQDIGSAIHLPGIRAIRIGGRSVTRAAVISDDEAHARQLAQTAQEILKQNGVTSVAVYAPGSSILPLLVKLNEVDKVGVIVHCGFHSMDFDRWLQRTFDGG
jgi:hypothetical protein